MRDRQDPPIRLALVDDQTIFRDGLRALIEHEPNLEVVFEATGVQGLADSEVEFDVVLTGLALPDAARDEVIPFLRSRFRDVKILALTALADLATVQTALAAGADGYVLKSADTAELFAGIRAVAAGGLYLQPSIGVAFASRLADDGRRPAPSGLTPKETDVLRLLALGHTNAEIAHLRGTSLRTIETHRAHIHQKLDRHTRAELVRFSLEAGILYLDEDANRDRTEDPVRERRIDPVDR